MLMRIHERNEPEAFLNFNVLPSVFQRANISNGVAGCIQIIIVSNVQG